MNKPKYETYSQEELDKVIEQHKKFKRGVRGGRRAHLKFKDLTGLKFHGADMEGADFTGSILNGADLSRGNFVNASFYACDLRNANLERANFKRADFRGAYVAGANLTGANLGSTDLREGKIMQNDKEGRIGEMDLGKERQGKASFAGARMHETNLSGSRAVEADFSEADLTGIIIKDADLRGVNFTGANLTDADLSGCDLRSAKLEDTITEGVVLDNAEHDNEKLKEAKGTHRQIGELLKEKGLTLQEMIEKHAEWIKTSGRDGEQMDISNTDMRSIANLKDYPITALKAINVSFVGLDLSDAQMQFCQFDNSDFRDCHMMKADLRGSRFIHVKMNRANLSGANLSPLVFKRPDGTQRVERVNLSGSDLRFANLRGANLSHAVLMGTNLENADLTGANLKGADLTGAGIRNLNLKDANTDGAVFDKTEIVSS